VILKTCFWGFGYLDHCGWVQSSYSVSVIPDYVPPFASVDLDTLDMMPRSSSAVAAKNRNKGKTGEYIPFLSSSAPHWINLTGYTYHSIRIWKDRGLVAQLVGEWWLARSAVKLFFRKVSLWAMLCSLNHKTFPPPFLQGPIWQHVLVNYLSHFSLCNIGGKKQKADSNKASCSDTLLTEDTSECDMAPSGRSHVDKVLECVTKVYDCSVRMRLALYSARF
jgi:hypothetical protein